jgi:hypothetical protein
MIFIEVVAAMLGTSWLLNRLTLRSRALFCAGLFAAGFGLWLAFYNADRHTGYCIPNNPALPRALDLYRGASQCAMSRAGEIAGGTLLLGGIILAAAMIREKRRASRAVPDWLRAQVWVKCHGVCAGCGRPGFAGDPLQIDHIIPFSRGGPTTLDNLQLLHRSENIAKGNRMVRY